MSYGGVGISRRKGYGRPRCEEDMIHGKKLSELTELSGGDPSACEALSLGQATNVQTAARQRLAEARATSATDESYLLCTAAFGRCVRTPPSSARTEISFAGAGQIAGEMRDAGQLRGRLQEVIDSGEAWALRAYKVALGPLPFPLITPVASAYLAIVLAVPLVRPSRNASRPRPRPRPTTAR
ncbi:hypothetical protein OH76DRAFT_960857 [Lentinus brumalis]|uniref:Uncharacterized protein n=1 Tax=Lentinus brumalis TaxID=2498619 RepID=A0A371DPF1_9APHY|nr:hypothetical protein OH76DRAFT_960857 [Polyporus brumalis]